jgi:3-hydroxybutyryl-CoA dehydrogenase
MGHGIAQVAAAGGFEVRLADATTDFARRGYDRIADNLTGAVRRAKMTEAERAHVLARVRIVDDVAEAARDVDLAIEAVPERMDLKGAVFTALDEAAPATAILATNTSSLSITAIQEKTARPARVIGLHFFNPVHLNPLLEVVRGGATSDATLDAALAFAAVIGKEAVVVNDSPGFATSRLGVLLGLEAMRMVEEGVATAEAIDRALELGYRHPMGPLRLTDLVGLDVRLDIARYLHEQLGAERFKPPAILERLVSEGKLGKKTGEGFYRWEAS